MATSPLQKVAIVGATGRIGGYFAEELLKTGKHTVTAITRKDSKGVVPEGAITAAVDYDDEASLVEALKGQQILIITLGVRAAPDLHGKIVAAAAKAKVPHLMPNTWGNDITNPVVQTGSDYGARIKSLYDGVVAAGIPYTVMVCGFWYEWSLGLGKNWYGFDIKNKEVTFYDDGETKIDTSTWDQCGRAMAAFLSLPESGAHPCFDDWKNKPLYINSWKISQRDMLDSLNRVLKTTDADWKIEHQPSKERYEEGQKELANGDFRGFAKLLYARMFYKDGSGDYSTDNKLANEALGLPKESLDEATQRAVDMANSDYNPFAD